MRKLSLLFSLLVVFSCFSLTCPVAHSAYNPRPDVQDDQESLDDIKTRIRRQVQDEMGPRKAPLPPNPASAKDAIRRPTAKQSSRQTQTKMSIEIPMPFDMNPDVAFRLAFIIMLFALVPASIARIKGRSFIAWWVLGTLFFIFVMPISVFIKSRKRSGTPVQKTPTQKAPAPAVKAERSWEKPSEPEARISEENDDSAIEVYAKIENLAKLKEKGILTEEEFKAKKNELLSRI